jgi:predicted permease
VDAVLLRLLPVRDPNRLVFVQALGTAGRSGPPYPYFEMIRDRAKSFESVAAFSHSAMELGADRGRELVRGVWVSGNFYEALGVRAILGRTLTADDDRTSGTGAVAVISRTFWLQRFGGDPAVVGRSIRLFKVFPTIVGVMPDETMSLEPGSPVDIAAPMAFSDPAMLRDRTSLWLNVVGRLKSGVDDQQARAESDGLFQAYMADVQLSEQIRKLVLQRIELSPAGQGLSGLRKQFSKPLTVLMILSGLVLLAACVNVANLLLAKATARQRDFAVRLAIGSSRGRLVRQNLTETLVLVGTGAFLGILLAVVCERALSAFFAEGNRSIVLDLALNARVLTFTVVVAVLSGLALGILPAMRAARLGPVGGLQGGSRSIAGSRLSIRLGRALVVVQVALSVILLAGAGLFVRSLRQLESQDLGFLREGILTMEVTPQREMFGTTQWFNLQNEVLDRIRGTPGVQSASWATMMPFSGRDRGAVIDVPGFTPAVETDKHIHMAAISPEYFSVNGVSLLSGRGFAASDQSKVAILNEAAARFYFGNSGWIGKKIRFTNYPGRELVYEVVGVVKDMKHDSVRDAASRFVYVPIQQSPDRINRLALSVRLSGNPKAATTSIRDAVQSANPTLLITNVTTMEEQVGRALQQERLVAALSSAFGGVALTLSGIGLYGILAYEVKRRTREIGIRMALGATRAAMVWMVLREGLVLATAGILIGVPVVLLLAPIAEALLYGVTPLDPMTLSGSTLLLLGFAVLAGIVPARAASLLDPTSALRRE